MKPVLLYLVTEDWYFCSHRLPMARTALKAGYDVVVVTHVNQHGSLIESEGFRLIPLSLERRNLNLFQALRKILMLARIYRREKPLLVHHIAMKPILYGSVAAWMAGVPCVLNAFAGLGFVFRSDATLARGLRLVLVPGFRVLFRRKGFWTLFQNRDDRAAMERLKIPVAERTTIIRGSGVDVDRYAVEPLPDAPPFICVYAGRMIDMKGLPTLQAAFEIIRGKVPHIHLWLCGVPDPETPGSWDESRLRQWCADNPQVTWMGHQPDMSSIWPQAHLALQPTWGGEGLPKALLEAGACARAMVASDISGCREVVVPSVNGFLVPEKDPQALADAIIAIASDLPRCAAMGLESRRIVEGDMSAESVSRQIGELYGCIRSTHILSDGKGHGEIAS